MRTSPSPSPAPSRARLLALVTGLVTALVMALGAAAPVQADPRVGGDIGVHHETLGGSAGFLGRPLTPEIRTPNGRGAYVVFEHGSIYWSPSTGAHEVHGKIRDAWAWAGWENGVLGFPLTDEVVTPDGDGAYNVFEGGSIYWVRWEPQAAHVVRGAIRDAWASRGWELGRIGYPTSSEFDIPGGRRQNFQRGFIEWSPATGARINQSLTTPDLPGCPFAPQGATPELTAHCFVAAWLRDRPDVMREYGTAAATTRLLAHPPRGELVAQGCGPNPRYPLLSWATIACTARFTDSGQQHAYSVSMDVHIVGIMRNAEVGRVWYES